MLRHFYVALWNGARWERESDESWTDPVHAYTRAGEMVRSGVSIDDVTVREVES